MKPIDLLASLYQRNISPVLEDGELFLDAQNGGVDDELLALVRKHKADLIGLLESLAHDAISTVPEPLPRGPAYASPVSLAQERMLFLEELGGGRSYYNMPAAFSIAGALDRTALAQSLTRLVTRHGILRSTYLQVGQGYAQQIAAPAPLPLHEADLRGMADQDRRLAALLQEEADYQFDLGRGWPIRAVLVCLAPEQHVLSITIHHIAGDGWSGGCILREINAGYRYFLQHPESDPIAAVPAGYQYADFTDWQNGWLKSDAFQADKAYWSRTLAGMPQLHGIATDFPRPAAPTTTGSHYRHTLSAPAQAAVAELARNHGTTPFVIFQSTFAALLARYSGGQDIVFGTAVANRVLPQFSGTVGLFVNTLVLRHELTDTHCFRELIPQAIAVNADALRHQMLPFDALVDELQPARSAGYNPLVQIMLVMQEEHVGLDLEGLQVARLQQSQAVSKFDLALHVHSEKETFHLQWEYNCALFGPETIHGMAAHYERLLCAALMTPDTPLDRIVLVEHSSDVRDADPVPVLPSAGLIEQIESWSARTPDAPALLDGAGTLTYRQLADRVTHLAHRLYRACEGRPGRIGVCMERSAELVISMLAILKIGGVYVPLDPTYPAARLDFMIKDAGMQILLADDGSGIVDAIRHTVPTLRIGALEAAESGPCALALPPAPAIEAPAYIIYTSGSTGQPKGVLVSHRALLFSLQANASLMGLTSRDAMPTIGSQAFGVSLLEILLPLVFGGSVRLVKKMQVADLQELIALTDQVTVMHAVPSLMQQWLDAVLPLPETAYPHLRLLLIGGEPVPESLLERIRRWRPDVQLLELYGMTESAIVCCSHEANAPSQVNYCLGKPHPHARFFVLNRALQQQPVGVPGELYIGGPSVATEYIGKPQITAERFIPSPFTPDDTLYRTGDLVRLRHDRQYEFLGRVDHQVSLRGARIELGEIELLAAAVPGVRQAVAHVLELDGGDKTLVLYLTADQSVSEDLAATARQHLARHLPDYMRPSLIELVERFPLNPNGKVDRMKLPRPRLTIAQAVPASELEHRLHTLWSEVLRQDRISVTANFFEIGGNSLMATRLVTRMRAEFKIALPLVAMFDAPTIRTCAAIVETALQDKLATGLIGTDDNSTGPALDELLI